MVKAGVLAAVPMVLMAGGKGPDVVDLSDHDQAVNINLADFTSFTSTLSAANALSFGSL